MVVDYGCGSFASVEVKEEPKVFVVMVIVVVMVVDTLLFLYRGDGGGGGRGLTEVCGNVMVIVVVMVVDTLLLLSLSWWWLCWLARANRSMREPFARQ